MTEMTESAIDAMGEWSLPAIFVRHLEGAGTEVQLH
jgi:hypothetical protein